MAETKDLLKRVEELELKVTFQDDLIEELNQVVIGQQKEIRLLTQALEKMSHDMQDIRQPNVIDQKLETPPPHY